MYKINLKSSLRLSVCLLLFSCSTTQYEESMNYAARKKQADTRQVHIFDGEVEPSMPDLDKNNKTILGIDSNNNQIRDDIEIWINRTAKNYNERKSMKQFARSEYEQLLKSNDLLANVNNKAQTLETSLGIQDAEECLAFIFYTPGFLINDHLIEKINLLLNNTQPRKDFYWEYIYLKSRSSSHKPKKYPFFCNFEINDKDQTAFFNQLLDKQFEVKKKNDNYEKKINEEKEKLIRQQEYELMKKTKEEQKPLF